MESVNRMKTTEEKRAENENNEELPNLPGNLPPEIFKLLLGKIDNLETALNLLSVNKEVAKWTDHEIWGKLEKLEIENRELTARWSTEE